MRVGLMAVSLIPMLVAAIFAIIPVIYAFVPMVAAAIAIPVTVTVVATIIIRQNVAKQATRCGATNRVQGIAFGQQSTRYAA